MGQNSCQPEGLQPESALAALLVLAIEGLLPAPGALPSPILAATHACFMLLRTLLLPHLLMMAGRLPDTISPMEAKTPTAEVKKRFCSTGSHWTTGEFRKIGTTRWICFACFKRRQAELRNLTKNKLLAAGGSAKK